MRIRLFYGRSVHENAAHYYDLAKETREKIAGLEKAIEETKKEIAGAGKEEKKGVRVKRQKEWHEKFHFALTSGGRLLIGGRNAQQNDQVVAKHMEDGDMFFHADIQGASAVILKGGAELIGAAGPVQPAAGSRKLETGDWKPATGSQQRVQGPANRVPEPGTPNTELAEAAQFAASFSKAWVNGNASVDVYAVRRAQLSKHAQGGFIPAGAFAISGERAWFRGTRLGLKIGMDGETLRLLPELGTAKLQNPLVLLPSRAGKEKGALAKSLAKRYGIHPDELLEILPNGKTKTAEV